LCVEFKSSGALVDDLVDKFLQLFNKGLDYLKIIIVVTSLQESGLEVEGLIKELVVKLQVKSKLLEHEENLLFGPENTTQYIFDILNFLD
jgi:hypothetical protein